MKILFVCLGNICRSPLAEGIFSHLVNSDEWKVDSAGTSAYHVGEKPDRRSIEIASTFGIDISHQKSRQLVKNDFYTYDYIMAMDKSNLNNINSFKPEDTEASIYLLRHFDDLNPDEDVPDPYYGGNSGFLDCYKMIERSCKNFLKWTNEK